MIEVTPWDKLNGQNPTSIDRLADMLMATKPDQTPAFGKAGMAIGEELKEWVRFKAGQVAKKEARKKKQAGESVEHQWEIGFLKEFYKGQEELTGMANKDWGRDRKCLRSHREKNPEGEPEQLMELIPVFFEAGKDEPWITGDYSVRKFLANLVRIREYQVRSHPKPLRESFIPEALT